MEEGSNPDRQHRHASQLTAQVIRQDGSETTSRVIDFSLEGCCLDGWYSVGEFMTVSLPRIGRMRAQVRWAAGGRAGLLFTRSEGMI